MPTLYYAKEIKAKLTKNKICSSKHFENCERNKAAFSEGQRVNPCSALDSHHGDLDLS